MRGPLRGPGTLFQDFNTSRFGDQIFFSTVETNTSPEKNFEAKVLEIKCWRINKTMKGGELFPLPRAPASIIHDPLSRPITADSDRLATARRSVQVANPLIYISGVVSWRRSPSVLYDDLEKIPLCFSLYFVNLSFLSASSIFNALPVFLCDGFDVGLHFPHLNPMYFSYPA